MLKTLMKKQMLEVFSGVYQDRKTKQRKSAKSMVGYALLCIVLFGYLFVMFYFLADWLCEPLVSVGFGWLYMTLMGVLAATFGVFGSVFSTYSSLYQAKDNDVLLSMPIPTKYILYARLFAVYAVGLLYELLIMIPVLVVYFINAPFEPVSFLFCLLIPFVLSIFVLALSCILGWIVALVTSKLKNQKILTVILSLGFFGVYYYFCGNMSTIIEKILMNPAGLGDKVKGPLYPFYQMGLAAEGDASAMLIFVSIIVALFTVVYIVLNRSFLKLATTNRGSAKVKYVEKRIEGRSQAGALLHKELRRFLGSTNYMLNCGLGIVFMLFAAVMLIVKKDTIVLLSALIHNEGVVALVAVALICAMSSMNDISAPSVSLEGKNIWLLQVLPVSGWDVLKAKLSLHLILTLVPVAVLTVCVELVIKPSLLFAILIPVIAMLFVLLMGILGLAFNLKMPNLNWTHEVVPIKQSASVFFALFGGWVIEIILGVGYYFLYDYIRPGIFMICVCGLLFAVNVLLLNWLKTRGSQIFERL